MKYLCSVFMLILIAMLCVLPAQAAPTSEVHLTKFAEDDETVLAEKTVGYEWMEENLPVQGDGVTHYYMQGPVFSDDNDVKWDHNETANFKDHGAVKGTAVKDLCDLVGGMEPGDEVMLKAGDGYHLELSYENVCNYSPRQGPVTLCWYNGEDPEKGARQGVGYPPEYYNGMHIMFMADDSTNAEGKHVYGNWDMHETMSEAAFHFYDLSPSTNGYAVKWVDEIRVYKGGYDGERNAPVKSLNEPASAGPEPTESPLSFIVVCAGLIGGLLAVRRP